MASRMLAKQLVVQKTLKELAVAEDLFYRSGSGHYADIGNSARPGSSFRELDIIIPNDCDPYIFVIEMSPVVVEGYRITAEGNLDDDATYDKWGIGPEGEPHHDVDDLKN